MNNAIILKQIELENEILSLKKKLAEFPEGSLHCRKNENRFKWYHKSEKGTSYIPKSNRIFAEQLAQKKYYECRLNDCLQRKKVIDYNLCHYDKITSNSAQLLFEQAGYKELLAPFFHPLSDELSEWSSSEYKHNTSFPENLTQQSCSGIFVRSKSETMIDMILYQQKIPYRYECALDFGNTTIYPDFTIRHPQSGDYYYWEHFGLMDRPEYYAKAFDKLKLYAAHGIIPTVNLITTFETQAHPLNLPIVEKLVTEYFL